MALTKQRPHGERRPRVRVKLLATETEGPVYEMQGRDLLAEPVSRVQWVHRDTLRANDYNPNHVAPQELELLIVSILEDGWTQPIVTGPEQQMTGRRSGAFREIIDGFHRYTVSDDPRLLALYAGMVPVTEVPRDRVGQMMSTIRHNRARGQHGVVPMSRIVERMVTAGVTVEEFQARLGMEDEEVARLADRAGMPVRGAVLPERPEAKFGQAWTPTLGAGDRGGAAPPARVRKQQTKKPAAGRKR